ncbi:Fe-regulated protein 8, partial [Lachnellula cervina]
MFSSEGFYRPHILVVGGSYGGLSVVANLLNLMKGGTQMSSPELPPELENLPKAQPRITILDERDGIYHTMGSPLVMSSSSFAREAWRYFKDIPQFEKDVCIVQGRALSIDVASRVAKYHKHDDDVTQEMPYDFLVVATGTQRRWPVVPEALHKTEYLQNVDSHIQRLRDAKQVVVVGGGAVGVEFAAEVKTMFPKTNVTLIQSRPTLLASEPLPTSFKQKAADRLEELGIEVRLGCRVVSQTKSSIEGHNTNVLALSNGASIVADEVICTNLPHNASTDFLPKEILDGHGYISVQSTLQFPSSVVNAELHYAVGDAVSWSGIKRVGNAFIMGQFVATNLLMQIHGGAWAVPFKRLGDAVDDNPVGLTKLVDCPPMKPMMALSLGKLALVYRGDDSGEWTEEDQEAVVGRGLGIE